MDKFRDIYREAVGELPGLAMDAEDVRDELRHRRRRKQRRRYLVARGCAAACVFLLCGAGAAAAKNYRASVIRVEDGGVTITGGQDAGVVMDLQDGQDAQDSAKGRRVSGEMPENASFSKMGGVFPIEQDIPEREGSAADAGFPEAYAAGEDAGPGAKTCAERNAAAAEACAARNTAADAGSVEAYAARAGSKAEACAAGEAGSKAEACAAGEAGSKAEACAAGEAGSKAKACAAGEAGSKAEAYAAGDGGLQDEAASAGSDIREYDSMEKFREAEDVAFPQVDKALFDEEFSWERVIVIDGGRQVMYSLSDDEVFFTLSQQDNRDAESYSTGISYGGQCGNERSFTNRQGLSYVLFDSLDEEGRTVAVHGVLSLNGWDLEVTFENFGEGIAERILEALDLSVYF